MPTTPPRSGRSSGIRPPCRTAAVTRIPTANSGHCSVIPGTVAPLWEPATHCVNVASTAPATMLPTPRTTPCTFPASEPTIGMGATLERGPSLDQSKTPALGPSAPRHVEQGGQYPPQQSPQRPLEPQGRRRDLRKAKDDAQDNRRPGAMISSAPQCTFYNSCSLCAPDSGRNGDFFPLPYMYTAPPCVYKRGRRVLSSRLSLSSPRSHTTNPLATPARSPDIGTCLN